MDFISVLILSISVFCVYVVGLYLHVKVILVSKKEKEIAWKLHVTNSVLLIFHFTHKLFMHVITYIIPDLYTYTGEWFCYTSKVFTYYGTNYTAAHSMFVSIMKCILIVQWKKVRDIGKDKIVQLFFFLNFLHPLITISLHLIFRPDFFWAYDGYAQIDRCFGDPKGFWTPGSNVSQTKLHDLCDFKVPLVENYFEYIFRLGGLVGTQ